MSLILNIESSGQTGSVSLAENGKALFQIKGENNGTLSADITVYIKELLKVTGKSIDLLEAVGVSLGPGSYTSLRIGLSVAKGICYGKGIPLIGLPTLEILGKHGIRIHNQKPGYYISMIDARRMDVYASIYNEKEELILKPSFVTISKEWLDQWNTEDTVFLGDGATKVNMFIEYGANEMKPSFQSANMMDLQTYEEFKDEKFMDLAYSVPFYLKPPNITKAKNIL